MFRHILTELSEPFPEPFDLEEMAGAAWAAGRAVAMANGNRLDATEAGCVVEMHGLLVNRPIAGTMDVLCSAGQWSGDLKSGQKRSYVAQQALYALGCMERHFCDEWVVFLFYCDLHTVEALRYTSESASAIVRDALAHWKSGSPPVANDYCGWCANRLTCPTRRESLGHWLAPTGLDADPAATLAAVPSEKLVAFVNVVKALESWDTEARDILKSRATEGEKIAGVKLVPKRGSGRVDMIHLLDPITTGCVDLGNALMAGGQITESKARELWPALPDELIFEAPGRVELHVSRPKKALTQTKNQ